MGTPNRPVATSDMLWNQYELHVELYKQYLDLLLKFNAFYYAATGAILSYYFSKPELPWMRYSLLFPVLMSAGFATLFAYGACQSEATRLDIFKIRDELGLYSAPEYRVLKIFLFVSAGLMVIVAVAMLGIVIFVRLPMPTTLSK